MPRVLVRAKIGNGPLAALPWWKGAFGVPVGSQGGKRGVSVLCPHNLFPPSASANAGEETRGPLTESFAGTEATRSVVETVCVETVAVSSRF